MITLDGDHLEVRFPEVHPDARMAFNLQRTLRVPDSDEVYPLPPGLGRFPLRHIEDFSDRVPEAWSRRGGVIVPMYQAEAMWINFGSRFEFDYPCAVKIGTGKINAVSGKTWSTDLVDDPQDYVVLPGQPWLDGYASADGIVRQFVAMPLGAGLTVEQHLSGKEEHGGIQILIYPMKAERYRKLLAERQRRQDGFVRYCLTEPLVCHAVAPMGLAAGGRIRQEVYRDEYGVDAWDMEHVRRCFVTIVNSEGWTEVTGEPVPTTPVSADDYARAGLPWFDHYNEKLKPISSSALFRKLPSLPGMKRIREWKSGVHPKKMPVVELGPSVRPSARRVNEGDF
jgi:hypothetical protein